MQPDMKLFHLGEILKMEIVEGRNLTIGKAAELLDLTRPTLSNIMNGKAGISPNVALRIETVFGGSAKLWVGLQASYVLDVAKKLFALKTPLE